MSMAAGTSKLPSGMSMATETSKAPHSGHRKKHKAMKEKRKEKKTWRTGLPEGSTERANFEREKTCTFVGVYEDFVLPFLTSTCRHSRTPFHSFVGEGIVKLLGILPLCAEGSGEQHCPPPPLDLLPCGVPYKRNPIFLGLPLRLQGLSGACRARRLKVLRRQAWINQMVCGLSWVFLGRPRDGTKAVVMCSQLNDVQRHAVSLLSRWTRVQAPPGRRLNVTLPRGRGLRGLVIELAEQSGYGRTDISHPAGPPESDGAITIAQPIGVENASLPEASALVDLQTVLPAELFAMLASAEYLLKRMSAPEQDVLSLPRMCMRTPDWTEFAKVLVQRGLCVIADDSCSPLWGSQKRHLRAGVFGVEKPDSDKLRLIVDRRRKNATEQGLRSGLRDLHELGLIETERYALLMRHMTLPHASQFTDLMLPPRCHFLMNLMDCKDFFYLLRMPLAATWSTPVGAPVQRACFRGLGLTSDVVHCDLQEENTCSLFLRAPAMGDLKSVEIAQAAHTAVLLRGGLTTRQWISFQSPPPADRLWEGCYVDDYFQGIVVPAPDLEGTGAARAALLEQSESRLQSTCSEYKHAEFVIKHSKSQLRRTHAVIWGGELQSEEGW
eukprot:6024150-Amphidinium_carterae.1